MRWLAPAVALALLLVPCGFASATGNVKQQYRGSFTVDVAGTGGRVRWDVRSHGPSFEVGDRLRLEVILRRGDDVFSVACDTVSLRVTLGDPATPLGLSWLFANPYWGGSHLSHPVWISSPLLGGRFSGCGADSTGLAGLSITVVEMDSTGRGTLYRALARAIGDFRARRHGNLEKQFRDIVLRNPEDDFARSLLADVLLDSGQCAEYLHEVRALSRRGYGIPRSTMEGAAQECERRKSIPGRARGR